MFEARLTRSSRVPWHLLCGVLAALGPLALAAQEIPPEIQADRYLVQAQRQSQSGDYRGALATLDRILRLGEEGMAIPNRFWVVHAQTALDAEAPERAIESANKYLELVGQAGEDYRAVLEIMADAEEEIARLAREAAARAAADAEARRQAQMRAEEASRRAARAREEANRRAVQAREDDARRDMARARQTVGRGQRGVVGGILWGSAGGALYYFAEDLADMLAEDVEDLEDPENRDNVVLGTQVLGGVFGLVGVTSLIRGIGNWGRGAKAFREAEERLGQANMDLGLSVGTRGEIELVLAWRY